MVELIGLAFSPWSEKAKWALEARKVPYKWRTFAPLVGEPGLRFKLGKWKGAVTVPLLTDDQGRAYGDSADIARWADGHGEGPEMFPRGREAEVARFVALSERGLEAGRALSLRRMLRDREALAEMTPKPLRRVLGPLSSRIGGFGVRRTLRKYGAAKGAPDDYEAKIGAVLEELRAALAKASEPAAGKPKTLLGAFSFADVAMAQVLAFVEPPPFGLRVGAASRRAFQDASLRAGFEDLIAWRDALYEAHRPRRDSRG